MSQQKFLQTLPELMIPQLPAKLHSIQVHQPAPRLVQFHFGEITTDA